MEKQKGILMVKNSTGEITKTVTGKDCKETTAEFKVQEIEMFDTLHIFLASNLQTKKGLGKTVFRYGYSQTKTALSILLLSHPIA